LTTESSSSWVVPAARAGGRAERIGVLDRDPASQAFIESWLGKLKEREVWLNEYETIDDARRGIGGYVDRYHHRPHSSLDYRTPLEVRQTLGGSARTRKNRGLGCQLRRGAGQDHTAHSAEHHHSPGSPR
jgi:Integrase core domain